MVEVWDFLHSPASDAARNMALDEALLRTAAQRGRPLLRVYAWERRSVSIGYFQKFPAQLAATHVVVRRPTGGGLVYHGDDTTYTVIAPPTHGLCAMKMGDAYCALHKAVVAAFDSQPALHAAALNSPRGQYECFQEPVHGDVVAGGKKLAGAAQRRTKWGLLHQGSIAEKISDRQLADGFSVALGAEFRQYEVADAERKLAGELVREKYLTDAWNCRVR